MNLHLVLRLPPDPASASIGRHLCASALAEAGAGPDTIDDVSLAVTEACANVVNHAGPLPSYELRLDLEPRRCVVTVADRGPGLDPSGVEVSLTDHGPGGDRWSQERGRGVALMRAVMDSVRLSSRPGRGTTVRLEKRLDHGAGGCHSGAALPPRAALSLLRPLLSA